MAKPVDNPIDSGIDLGFVNFIKHPQNPDYVVFRFRDENRAKTFEEVLTEKEIWFEKAEQEKKGKLIRLFGVHKDDFKKVQQINFDTEATHRNFIIKNNVARWGLLIFVGAVILLALAGYIIQNLNN